MQLKVSEVIRVYAKLNMKERGGHHKMAFFEYDGKTILKTRLSHGSGDAKAADKIRQDFKLNEKDFADLVKCPLTLTRYVEILKGKKLIN